LHLTPKNSTINNRGQLPSFLFAAAPTRGPDRPLYELPKGPFSTQASETPAADVVSAAKPPKKIIENKQSKSAVPVYVSQTVELLHDLDKLLRDRNHNWGETIERAGSEFFGEIVAGMTAKAEEYNQDNAIKVAADRAEASTRLLQ
jgi:hypothetical protein